MSAIDPRHEQFLVERVLGPFYEKRLASMQAMSLDRILKSKNPYLFRAKNIGTAGELTRNVTEAFLSSQEETVFGNLLEDFAVYVSFFKDGGFKRKPSLPGIDLEFQRDGIYYIVGIKSGTAWGNADQIRIMKNNFAHARRQLRVSENIAIPIVAVNGCMYGREPNPLKDQAGGRGKDKGTEEADKVYYKYAGQDFWYFLSGDDHLYHDIIVPLGQHAKGKDTQFREQYDRKLNELTEEFMSRFLTPEKDIDWSELIDFVSRRVAQSTP